MPFLLHHTLFASAGRSPDAPVLIHRDHDGLDFERFALAVEDFAALLSSLGVAADDRVAVYLGKTMLTPVAFYGTAAAGGVFVPVNPVLKAPQVRHILRDCNVRILVTSPERLKAVAAVLGDCPDLRCIVLSESTAETETLVPGAVTTVAAAAAEGLRGATPTEPPGRTDNDMAAILYTSGSTGSPKGVVVSHRNVVAGARSVASYLGLTADDRLLAVLPFSFDYGLNQLTSAVVTGARCVLFDYLLPRDVMREIAAREITGLAAVPPLWAQLAALEWPAGAADSVRYITNSGGALPEAVLQRLRAVFHRAEPYLMYGLTEAFRSTYLPPAEIDQRRGSIGRAVPNAEILVVDGDGREVPANTPGELVHRGAFVALGYWNDPDRTALRFRPAPNQLAGLTLPEIAVWSGDTVTRDDDGYLYFVGRDDGMIKTSGYRVSPEEVEAVAYAFPEVETAAAVGIPDPALGQAIVLALKPAAGAALPIEAIQARCRGELPNYMHPRRIVACADMPTNPNGKIDRRALVEAYGTDTA